MLLDQPKTHIPIWLFINRQLYIISSTRHIYTLNSIKLLNHIKLQHDHPKLPRDNL